MKTAPSGRMRLAARAVPLAALVGAASLVASGSYSGESAHVVRYQCPNGERFAVEHLEGHVRLRTGSGVFALAADPNTEPLRYSDGHTAFRTDGNIAILERPGIATPADCTAVASAL